MTEKDLKGQFIPESLDFHCNAQTMKRQILIFQSLQDFFYLFSETHEITELERMKMQLG